jgi:hypothetical protein
MLPCMAMAPRIPRQLKAAPFSVAEARHHGLSLRALSGKAWRRIGSELYCWRELEPESQAVLAAWKRALPPKAVFAGKTAAWILGLDFEPTGPVEIALPPAEALRGCFGLRVRRCEVSSREVRTVRARQRCCTEPCDGGNHRERLVDDDRRQNRLIEAGFRVLRFTSADVYQRPEAVAAQVRGAMGRFGTKTVAVRRGRQGLGAKKHASAGRLGRACLGQQPTWFWHMVVEIVE